MTFLIALCAIRLYVQSGSGPTNAHRGFVLDIHFPLQKIEAVWKLFEQLKFLVLYEIIVWVFLLERNPSYAEGSGVLCRGFSTSFSSTVPIRAEAFEWLDKTLHHGADHLCNIVIEQPVISRFFCLDLCPVLIPYNMVEVLYTSGHNGLLVCYITEILFLAFWVFNFSRALTYPT